MIKYFVCLSFFYLTENKKSKIVCFRKGVVCLKKLLKIVLICILVGVGVVGGFLAYMTLTKEQPADVISLKVENNKERVIAHGNEFKVTTFNIGYAGLDKDQDFFMDGGKGVWFK